MKKTKSKKPRKPKALSPEIIAMARAAAPALAKIGTDFRKDFDFPSPEQEMEVFRKAAAQLALPKAKPEIPQELTTDQRITLEYTKVRKEHPELNKSGCVQHVAENCKVSERWVWDCLKRLR